jgi:hypothetical protein
VKKHRKLSLCKIKPGGGEKKKKGTPEEGGEMIPQMKRKLQKKQPI